MFTQHRLISSVTRAALAGIVLVPGAAFADPILPGYDLFSTPGPTEPPTTPHASMKPHTFVDLPFGHVDLKGRPIDPKSALKTTDTIVQRIEGIDSFNVGDSGTVAIELVALSLQSVNPIAIPGMQGMFDMFVTLDKGDKFGSLLPQPDALTATTGSMTISHDTVEGGIFTSSFPKVYADLVFTRPGGDPTDPRQVINSMSMPAPVVALGAADSTWSRTTKIDGYPVDTRYPGGGFYVIDIEHTGPHGGISPVPEPETWVLMGLGLLVTLCASKNKGWGRLEGNKAA